MRAASVAVLAGLAAGACFAQFRAGEVKAVISPNEPFRIRRGISVFHAGAAKAVITPDLARFAPVYLAGFGQNRVATGVHDDLYARCLALSAGVMPLVLCGVDSIGLFFEDVEKIRERARQRIGGPADVVIAALHDHEAPDTMGLWGPAPLVSGLNERYNRFLIDQTAEAAAAAVRALRPAAATVASVRSSELDSFIHDNRPPVVHDSELVILSVADTAGKPIATLVNWANHPETLASKNTLITADYPAYFYTQLEQRLGGIAVLLNGAVGGMQSPLGAKVVDPHTGKPAEDASFRKAEIIGTRVAGLAADAVGKAKKVRIRSIAYREKTVQIPVANKGFQLAAKAGVFGGRKPMREGAPATTVVGMFRLLDGSRPVLEGALVPGELYPELSVGGIQRYPGADFPDAPLEPPIRRMMKAPYRMLIGLANDEIGYIIPKAEWDEKEPWLQNAPRRWYGEVNAVGPEAAPLIAAAVEELLKQR